jgi:hypothetical protein
MFASRHVSLISCTLEGVLPRQVTCPTDAMLVPNVMNERNEAEGWSCLNLAIGAGFFGLRVLRWGFRWIRYQRLCPVHPQGWEKLFLDF